MQQYTAQQILKVRDALVKGDLDEAYHELYTLADPEFKYMVNPWQDIEVVAKSLPAEEEDKPEGPWEVQYMGTASSTEAGTEYDDWIEITDGKVTLYLDGGLEDNDEQLLVNFLNARKIKLDYDHESELAAHLLEQELKRANRVVQAQEEYIELLVKEIESMVAIAYVHGWRSDNHEKGARVREKIAALKEGRKEVENG